MYVRRLVWNNLRINLLHTQVDVSLSSSSSSYYNNILSCTLYTHTHTYYCVWVIHVRIRHGVLFRSILAYICISFVLSICFFWCCCCCCRRHFFFSLLLFYCHYAIGSNVRSTCIGHVPKCFFKKFILLLDRVVMTYARHNHL